MELLLYNNSLRRRICPSQRRCERQRAGLELTMPISERCKITLRHATNGYTIFGRLCYKKSKHVSNGLRTFGFNLCWVVAGDDIILGCKMLLYRSIFKKWWRKVLRTSQSTGVAQSSLVPVIAIRMKKVNSEMTVIRNYPDAFFDITKPITCLYFLDCRISLFKYLNTSFNGCFNFRATANCPWGCEGKGEGYWGCCTSNSSRYVECWSRRLHLELALATSQSSDGYSVLLASYV